MLTVCVSLHGHPARGYLCNVYVWTLILALLQPVITSRIWSTGWRKKKALFYYYCSYFVHCQPTLVIVGTFIHCGKTAIHTQLEHYMGYVVGPPLTVCVTTLRCKILIMTLFVFTCVKQPISCFDIGSYNIVNFCQNLMRFLIQRIIPDESYLSTGPHAYFLGHPVDDHTAATLRTLRGS